MPDEAAISAALRASESRYRRLFEAAQDGILLLNADTAQIEDANPYVIQLLGSTYARMLGKKLWEVGALVDRAKSEEMFAQLQATGYVRYDDLPLKTRSGELINVEFVSNAYDCEGVRVIQCNIRDVTDQRRAEEQVRKLSLELDRHSQQLETLVEARTQALAQAMQAAQAANVAKSAFLANMSHEIRTPLTAITGMGYLIRRSGVTPQQAAWLASLEAGAQHLLEVINAVLDLSQIEAGKVALQTQALSVAGVVAQVVALLLERATAKRLTLQVQLCPLPLVLLGDVTRLKQALLNYAGNALKFTDSGGVVLRVLCLDEQPGSQLLRFEVQDTGIGIDAQTLARLFTPFEQADNTTTRRYGGTGLGLAIVRQLAALMGGKAGASSTPGVGSIFWFTARLGKSAADTPPPLLPLGAGARLLGSAHAGARILLVDDERFTREVTLELLQAVIPQVEVADNGAEAVRMVTLGHYDLILMDVQMPVLDGMQATRLIRRLPHGATTPIIALTASAFAEDRALCLAAGMDGFLAKPFHPDELYELVVTWLARPAKR